MGSLANYAELKLLDHVFKVTPFSQPSNIYMALSKADPGESGGSIDEPSGGDYARVQVNSWNAAASRATANTSAIQFPRATADWGTITHWALFDASTSGNPLAYGAISNPSSLVMSNGRRARFAAGEVDIVYSSGGWSTTLANALLDHMLKGSAYSVPTNLYVGFSTANPGDSGGALAEPSGNNYSRTALNSWNAAASGATGNTNAFEGPAASGSWGTLTHVAIFDHVSAGNMLAYAALNSSLAITQGLFPEFEAGQLAITLN